MLHPFAGISGNIDIKKLKVDILFKAKLDNANGLKVLDASFNAVSVSYEDLHITLFGLYGILFPLVNLLTWAIRGKIKEQFLGMIGDRLVGGLDAVVKSHLPFVVPLPGS